MKPVEHGYRKCIAVSLLATMLATTAAPAMAEQVTSSVSVQSEVSSSQQSVSIVSVQGEDGAGAVGEPGTSQEGAAGASVTSESAVSYQNVYSEPDVVSVDIDVVLPDTSLDGLIEYLIDILTLVLEEELPIPGEN